MCLPWDLDERIADDRGKNDPRNADRFHQENIESQIDSCSDDGFPPVRMPEAER